ncbi:hypothetical protein ACUXAV_005046 [Cupriavidus metallidurans]|jgi:hypothetical protein|uniref:hypothetical protein n=1 Tax=Cupriavidus TaxID=106589 RepID=UPI000B25155E|nr:MULTISPECIES: hypothetical protein [Cupriavidus]MDE4922576.1 hypothetical protein [Cupriavidus metallidurans]
MSTSRQVDFQELCPHCGQDCLATLYEDNFGYESSAAHCHGCGYRVAVDIGDGGGVDASIQTNKLGGMIVSGCIVDGESCCSMTLGSLIGGQTMRDREISNGSPPAWFAFVDDVGVTVLRGAPADDPAFADIVLDARKRLDELEVVSDEQLQDIPEPIAL